MAHRAGYRLKQLADHSQTSVRTLQRRIASLTGQPAGRWIRQLRMVRAAALLTEGFKVEWVTGELGYASRPAFARVFKKHWGHPPGQHARRNNKLAVEQRPKQRYS